MENQLRRLQLTQLEILKVIDHFCRVHKIHYSLYAGSLLGAIRHKGFIPWDDDLDIFMTRHEYNRFIKLWIKEGPDGYLIQNKELVPSFTQSFTKIRKEHTTFLQFESERGQYHTGIFVDIFPIDRVPPKGIRRYVFDFDCLCYQLYTREFVPPLSGRGTKIAASLLLKLSSIIGRERLRSWHYSRIVRYNRNTNLPLVCIEMAGTLHQIYPPELMKSYINLPFENLSVMCIQDWDTYLSTKFGEYMILPPEDEQGWRHHPLVLDFDKSLDE